MPGRKSVIVPSCKPLRLIEWVSVIICFLLMFFTRAHTSDQISILSPNELIYLFIAFGSLTVLTGGDVVSQLIKEPTPNVPMILVTLLGTVFCFIAGIVLVVSYQIHSECDARRIMSAVGLIIVGSFFSTVVYLIDTIILIRFASPIDSNIRI